MDSEIATIVIRLAASHSELEPGSITPETHFVNDLEFDSLDTVEYAMKLEDEFGVKIEDEDLQKLQTVQAVIEYLIKRGAKPRCASEQSEI